MQNYGQRKASTLHKEEIQMVNKYLKIYLTLVVTHIDVLTHLMYRKRLEEYITSLIIFLSEQEGQDKGNNGF